MASTSYAQGARDAIEGKNGFIAMDPPCLRRRHDGGTLTARRHAARVRARSGGFAMLRPINWSLALPYYAGALAFGYLLGSIPFGLILTRLAGTQDIRAIGSGNIGATNVLRTGRKGLAAATLLCDLLKGTVAVLVTHHFFGHDLEVMAGISGFLTHLFPVWL